MAEKKQYYYGMGRRKSATVTARLFTGGHGKIEINKVSAEDYFANNEYLLSELQEPFKALSQEDMYDVTILAKGGGHSGQVDAMKLAISKALAVLNEDYRSTLKRAGLMKRDPRVKERQKPGLKGARRAEQFSKR
jgi:small subunit ribosomal protein S9